MPSIPLHVQGVSLVDRASIIGSNAPNYKLFFIILGGIIACSLTASVLGCCMARRCQRRRRENQEKVEDFDCCSEGLTPSTSAASLSLCPSTVSSGATLIQDDFHEQEHRMPSRAANHVTREAFAAGEVATSQDEIQSRQKRRGEKGSGKKSSKTQSVALNDLKKGKQQPLSKLHRPGSHSEVPPAETPSTPSRVRITTSNRASRAHWSTSTDYGEPVQLARNIHSHVEQAKRDGGERPP